MSDARKIMSDEPEARVLSVRLPGHLVKKIDDWRRKQPDLPNRSKAVRRLVIERLAQEK